MANKKTPAEATSEREFNDFDDMMTAFAGLTWDDVKKLKSKDQDLNARLKKLFEGDPCGYPYIFACYPNDPFVRQIAEEFDLQVITHCMSDSADSYSTGMHMVNRERYYFCHSKGSGWCEEIWDDDEEDNE